MPINLLISHGLSILTWASAAAAVVVVVAAVLAAVAAAVGVAMAAIVALVPGPVDLAGRVLSSLSCLMQRRGFDPPLRRISV